MPEPTLGKSCRRASKRSSVRWPFDILGFGSLLARDYVEDDFLTFMQNLEPGSQNAFVVNEDILAVFLSNEAKALLIVPPLYFAAGHNDSSDPKPAQQRLSAG